MYITVPRLLCSVRWSVVVAHGKSLRALVMHLENINKGGKLKLDVLTGETRNNNLDCTLKITDVAKL